MFLWIHRYTLEYILSTLGYISMPSQIHPSNVVMYHLQCIGQPKINVFESNEKLGIFVIGKTSRI